MKKSAFTLAEVLITLGIIGVVAALTMPTLINNARQKELEANFKKKSAELQNALQMVQHDYGVTIYGNITNLLRNNANGYNVTIAELIIKQFKEPAKIINSYEINSGKVNGIPHSYKNYNGTGEFSPRQLDDGTIFINNEFFIFINNDNNIRTNQRLWVDVNGYKGPNRHGHDLFQFCLSEGDKLDFECDQYTQKALLNKDYFIKLPH
ncbi:type II secretion system protein [bacterium]|nr:type II secretion system protein [bacterium]